MATWLIIFVTVVYTYCAAEFLYYGNYPMAIVYFGYAVANCGLVWLAIYPITPIMLPK